MTIIAKTQPGREFIYNAKSAHKVSKEKALYICETCNEHKYRLNAGEKWKVYEIDEYSQAYDYALQQHGRVYKGIVKMYSPIM